ncbi:hypothetical protein A2737_01235 [Candidatus Nomurabacteria bacterium RIFCSPHIGHO2_01_FULL_41_71]|nr:MAG: hypothetical protein A2737_01235 [Candidatus Nomurabacteria bacterium RIFCSPHIGHO2_01_FULL_41_71]
MKNLPILLLILFFVSVLGFFGFGSDYAFGYYDSGCTGAGPFSVTSGRLCTEGSYVYNSTFSSTSTTPLILGCTQYSQYSTITGAPCYGQNYSQVVYAFSRELGPGLRGDDVATLQQILRDRGYSVGRVDGIYGRITQSAVLSYQLDNGLPVNGLADSATLTRLNNSSVSYSSYSLYPSYSTSSACPVTYVNGVPIYSCAGTAPVIHSIYPTSSRIGTQVTIYGSGFLGGNLNFGGYIISTSYMSDTQISFFIPSSLNNCYLASGFCTQVYVPVNPGNYKIYVSRSGYNSGTINFTVTY